MYVNFSRNPVASAAGHILNASVKLPPQVMTQNLNETEEPLIGAFRASDTRCSQPSLPTNQARAEMTQFSKGVFAAFIPIHMIVASLSEYLWCILYLSLICCSSIFTAISIFEYRMRR